MIACICDGCGDMVPQKGPNTSAVPTPPGWRQVSLEAHMQPTVVQHQCGKCWSAIEATLRDQRAQRNPTAPQRALDAANQIQASRKIGT